MIIISITKEQADLVRKAFPDIHIRRTAHKFYMEEDPTVLRFLGMLKPKSKIFASRGI